MMKKTAVSDIADEVLALCCEDVFENPNPKRNRDPFINVLGYSEHIHMRHLAAGGIPIGFTQFSAMINRIRNGNVKSCMAECFRTVTVIATIMRGFLH